MPVNMRQQAAAMLRRLLDATERGMLDAPGSQGHRLVRRMEGAAVALEESASPTRRAKQPGPSTGTTVDRPEL